MRYTPHTCLLNLRNDFLLAILSKRFCRFNVTNLVLQFSWLYANECRKPSFLPNFSVLYFISLAKYCEKCNDFSKLLKKKVIYREIVQWSLLTDVFERIYKASGLGAVSSNKQNKCNRKACNQMISKRGKKPTPPKKQTPLVFFYLAIYHVIYRKMQIF